MQGRPTIGKRRIERGAQRAGDERSTDDMKRAVIIGNSGGGKSTLARRLSSAWHCHHIEIDGLLWQPGWQLTPVEVYNTEHARLIADGSWIIDGLGRLDSIAERLARATHIVLVDMPLWVHFWLAAERQIKWSTGRNENPPAGLASMPPTEALFRTIWEVDQNWMPEIRRLVALEETCGKQISRLSSISRSRRIRGIVTRSDKTPPERSSRATTVCVRGEGEESDAQSSLASMPRLVAGRAISALYQRST